MGVWKLETTVATVEKIKMDAKKKKIVILFFLMKVMKKA